MKAAKLGHVFSLVGIGSKAKVFTFRSLPCGVARIRIRRAPHIGILMLHIPHPET